MKAVIVLEHRFDRTPDGSVWTQSPFFYNFWTRYLQVFEQVQVVARIRDVSAVGQGWRQANGDAVAFVPVPYYVGPWQYLQNARQIKQAVRAAVTPGDAVILRVSSQLGDLLAPHLQRLRYPYGVEVVADPYDVFAPGSVQHPLRPLFRWWFPRQLRSQCQQACATAYVTEFALQRRYPPAPHTFTTHYSSVELPDAAFVDRPRQIDRPLKHRIIFVGTLSQLYKAPDILIRAVAICVTQGLHVQLTLVGDGQYQSQLEALATEQGLQACIHFQGRLPAGEPVRAALDQADLFVLPSHQEGLPRAMIEAMARGLPCLGSTVGGIPELLEASEMVAPGDAVSLATKIYELYAQPQRMAALSQQNLERAQRYRNRILQQRRLMFYQAVQRATADFTL